MVDRQNCEINCCSPPARWGLLDFVSVACSSPPLLSSSSCSTATLDAQCSLSDLNHDHPRPVFPAGPQPRPSPPSVPCRTSTTTIHAQCSLPDLNREYPRQVFPAGPHVGRYGTKNVQKKVRKNVRQVCYILLAKASDKSGVNKLFWNVMVGITRSKVIYHWTCTINKNKQISTGHNSNSICFAYNTCSYSPFGPCHTKQTRGKLKDAKSP